MIFLLLVLLIALPFGRFLFPFSIYLLLLKILYILSTPIPNVLAGMIPLFVSADSHGILILCVFCHFLLWAQFCQNVICGKWLEGLFLQKLLCLLMLGASLNVFWTSKSLSWDRFNYVRKIFEGSCFMKKWLSDALPRSGPRSCVQVPKV